MANFSEQFDQHGRWRHEVDARLKDLADWLREQDLLDDGADERVRQLSEQLRSDKVMVAFVAEFSRGKSELINAVFFASYGRRIMPASAGRTTMCPTELGWDAELPPCLRLLPVHTRLQPQSLLEWRMTPEKWERVDLDINDPAQMASAMEKVSEVLHVPQEEARALGFWHDDTPQDNPPVREDGLVEVPRWRHALINMSHPLLKRGLVVLDTPGLNAIGAEPELTVSLIPQAQAMVFVLGADTGVTKSDLAIWREHLAALTGSSSARFVVLNKIDTLWDELSTPAQIEHQIHRQCAETARILELPADQVIAISAQKGLLAKVRGDKNLLAESRLPAFENILGHTVLGARQQMLEDSVKSVTDDLKSQASRTLEMRRREMDEQLLELRGLRGKNQTVITRMKQRLEQEKTSFDRSAASVLAVRSVHMKLLNNIFKLLSTTTIKQELSDLTTALRAPGIKLGIKKSYAQGFENLRGVVNKVQAVESEIHKMLDSSFRQLNAEYGFSLKTVTRPEVSRLLQDLSAVENSHLQYLGVGNMMRLAQPEFCEKLVRALLTRVRSIFEAALGEIELWNKASTTQIDIQLRERRQAYNRRIDAIARISGAAGGLDMRIAEIEEQASEMAGYSSQLENRVHALLLTPSPAATVRHAA